MMSRLEQLKNGSTFDSNDINWLLEQARLKKLLEKELDSYRRFYELAEAHLSEDEFGLLIERWND